jgi:electron transport complex protein RnfA
MILIALMLFASMSLNLLFSFGLGIRELVKRERSSSFRIYYPWVILFVVTFILWIFFRQMSFLWFPTLLLVYPLSVFGSLGLETAIFTAFPRLGPNPGIFSPGSSYNGLSLVSLFLALRFALTLSEAFAVSLSFSGGGLLAFLIVKEIQKRSYWEALPHSLKGTPILFISTGLLSLVFSSASVLLLKALLG